MNKKQNLTLMCKSDADCPSCHKTAILNLTAATHYPYYLLTGRAGDCYTQHTVYRESILQCTTHNKPLAMTRIRFFLPMPQLNHTYNLKV